MMLNKVSKKDMPRKNQNGETLHMKDIDGIRPDMIDPRLSFLSLTSITFRALAIAMVMMTATLGSTFFAGSAKAASNKTELNSEANAALAQLLQVNPKAADIAKQAKAVLIFPSIVKAGLVFGGAYGEGVLAQNNQITNYYNSVTASWGLQIGAQTYGYAVFLMTDKAVQYLRDTHGWEIGVGPAVVLVDEGASKNLSTSTLKDDAYAFIFDEKGQMAALTLEGTKITQIKNP